MLLLECHSFIQKDCDFEDSQASTCACIHYSPNFHYWHWFVTRLHRNFGSVRLVHTYTYMCRSIEPYRVLNVLSQKLISPSQPSQFSSHVLSSQFSIKIYHHLSSIYLCHHLSKVYMHHNLISVRMCSILVNFIPFLVSVQFTRVIIAVEFKYIISSIHFSYIINILSCNVHYHLQSVLLPNTNLHVSST
jgi:hypothetical protein